MIARSMNPTLKFSPIQSSTGFQIMDAFQSVLRKQLSWKELKKLRKLSNDINIALITEDDPLLAINSAKELNAVAINPNFKDLNTEVIKKIKNAGFDIYTWTVNKREDIEKIKKLNINGIITDYPDRF